MPDEPRSTIPSRPLRSARLPLTVLRSDRSSMTIPLSPFSYERFPLMVPSVTSSENTMPWTRLRNARLSSTTSLVLPVWGSRP